jgi:NADPH:quinone reductase-like Zn-dependent oxidoreductase
MLPPVLDGKTIVYGRRLSAGWMAYRDPGHAKGARVLTTVSTTNVSFARDLGADVVIDYKKQPFENEVSGVDMVFDLIDGETRERSWKVLKKGGTLITTLTDPSQDKAQEHGVRAKRYTVEADGQELAEIVRLVISGKVRPHIQRTFPLRSAIEALAAVEEGHSVGKIILSVN